MNDGLLTIGQLAGRAGISDKTIRFYQEEGLILPDRRSDSGYRLFEPAAAERLAFIRRGQGLGLKLAEIREVLELADVGQCPCGHVQTLLQAKLAELDARLADIKALRRRIQQALATPAEAAAQGKGAAVCPTIESQPVGVDRRRGGSKRNRKE